MSITSVIPDAALAKIRDLQLLK